MVISGGMPFFHKAVNLLIPTKYLYVSKNSLSIGEGQNNAHARHQDIAWTKANCHLDRY